MKEIWKDIKNFEGLYQISNFGRVKSLYNNKIRKPQRGSNGYLFLTLHKNQKIYNISIHRCVAKHFVKGEKENYEVNHIDGNKENNIYSNLEWVTKKENQKHAVDNNLRKTGDFVNTFLMKPVLCYDKNGNFIKEFDCTKRAALELNADPSSITKVLKGKKKTSKGYTFKYKL